MWGFRNSLNRHLAKKTYELIIDKELSKKYVPNSVRPRGGDQLFLYEHLYFKIKNISTIHDSYKCNFYNDSKPFPTKRKGNCFVGYIGNCNESASFNHKCPEKCRPIDHMDWEFC